MKEWLFLIGAIFLETFATSMLKYSELFTKLLPTTAMVVGYDTPGSGESVTFTESDSDELCARESKEWRGK